MDPQHFMDAICNATRSTRSEYHVTLGGIIRALSEAPSNALVVCSDGKRPGKPKSYRGYYSDLAFEPQEDFATAKELLQWCQNALGETFEGYKGGDYLMGDDTPLWVSPYGIASSDAVVAATMVGDEFVLTIKTIY